MPSDQVSVVLLRPVDGSEDDAVGIFTPLEPEAISESSYPPPDPEHAGDFSGAMLLRDAVRLTLRSGAGPFRSVGRLSVVPRPYQYVPLIMALRQDPVRLLIADDVGVGKTIEAAMVARELLDRGVIRRIGVLCPPHLCDQWAEELRDKFNIEAAVVQPSRMARLERGVPRPDIHVFEYYKNIVASIDFVKSDRHRRSFVDNAPDLIIVDEAHTATRPKSDTTGSQQRRFRLLKDLAADPKRHLILTTATPHSGVEESFRSLVGLLDDKLDMPIEKNIPQRSLVPYLVQRRRADLKNWLGTKTPFPERESVEVTYQMSGEYSRLYESILDFCRESVSGETGRRQRVRFWAAVAILRCVLSSPAAAEATLKKRADRKREELEQEIDWSEEEFSIQIMDSATDEDSPPDYAPTAPLDDPEAALTQGEIRRLEGFLGDARKLRGPKLDTKLAECVSAVDELLAEGYRPIVYCRFIDTAEYVAEQLQTLLEKKHKGIRVRSVTGGDGNNEQRLEIVESLAQEPVRVLVATDCLSEGINLQHNFDAVLHYDLPWNPNRLEQREGRVDRYGQERETVKTVMLYGSNNPIDLNVLNVLVRKARDIRRRLGISVAPPVESEQVIQALIENVLLRQQGGTQLTLDLSVPEVSALHKEWDEAEEREANSRAYFAQASIQPDEVERELREMEPALGNARDIQSFVANGIQRFNGELRTTRQSGVFDLHPGNLERNITERVKRLKFPMKVSFDGNPRANVTGLSRNHPIVTALSDSVLARALTDSDLLFARCGAIVTDAVNRGTAVVILRLRYLLEEDGRQQFAEEVVAAAFQRVRSELQWLEPYQEEALRLLSEAKPTANLSDADRSDNVRETIAMLQGDWASPIVSQRVKALKESHDRLRKMVKSPRLKVTPHDPDIIGCYVLVPSGGA